MNIRTLRPIALTCTLLLLICAAPPLRGQWQMQASGTRASLRGIHSVDGSIAWASGTQGTVLRTTDGGEHWRACSVPRDAEKLDFRSVWAWDAEHAMVLSSGPGTQSRLYSTQDGCHTWRLVFTNPDANGFWDGLQFDGARFGVILGDPVQGSFALFATYDGGTHWIRQVDQCLHTMEKQQGAFAASNQSVALLALPDASPEDGPATDHRIWLGTSGGWLYRFELTPMHLVAAQPAGCVRQQVLPPKAGAAPDPASGIFAIAFRNLDHGVAVGGNYAKPQATMNVATYTLDGKNWQPATHPPRGYRSTVAWNASDASWIAAGPTGSDVSPDGQNWQPLDNGDWNALSLPFGAGPHGRIGRLIAWGQLRTRLASPASSVPAQVHSTAKGQ
jgi:hypothetical protein